uniref:Uncharacterized protein n=1 Tax=Ditylenchus dipsaci TaxID=166011 RepID=A0A915EUD9_9BILA
MMTIKSFLWMLAALLFFSWKLMGCQKKGKDRPKKGTLTDPTSGVKAPLPQGTPAAAASAPTPTASGGTPVAVAAPTTPAVPANQTPAAPVQAPTAAATAAVPTQNAIEDEQQYEDVTIDDKAAGAN